MNRRKTSSAIMVGIAVGVALTSTGCTRQTRAAAPHQSQPAAEIVVVQSRIVEGTNLCAIASVEELEWLLGQPVAAQPAPDPLDPRACSARFNDATVIVAGRTAADGVRAMVAGNTAFAEVSAVGCTVSVALLPGSTQRAGSYLAVGVSGTGSQPERDCRTAGRLAEYLLDQLPRR